MTDSQPPIQTDRADEEIRAKRARERKRFEAWMRKKWGGIDLGVLYHLRHSFEYKHSAAQTAWEVWMKFTEVKP